MARVILRLDVGKAFFVQKELFSKGGVLHKDVVDRMTSPKSQVADLVFNVIKGSPELTRETNQVLSQFTSLANRGLSRGFDALNTILSSPNRLPQVTGAGRGGSKSIKAYTFSFRTEPWPDLSRSYWKSIKLMRKKGSRKLHNKRFWYERGDRTTASKPPGTPLHEMISAVASAGGESIFSTPLRHTITKSGSRTGFSFDANTVSWSRRRGHTSRRGRKVIRVGGFRGQLILPKTIPPFAADPLGEAFGTMLLTAVATERNVPFLGASFSINSGTGPSLVELLALNESTRPFISQLFSRTTPVIIERLRTLALTFK